MTALGIEEGTNLLHDLDGLCLDICSHGIFRVDDRGLEFGMEVFLAIVLLVGRRLLQLQQRTDLVKNINRLGEQSRFLHEVVGEYERCQLLKMWIFRQAAPAIEFLVMFLTVQAADDAQLHEVMAQDGIAFKEFRFCLCDKIDFLCIHLVQCSKVVEEFQQGKTTVVIADALLAVQHDG